MKKNLKKANISSTALKLSAIVMLCFISFSNIFAKGNVFWKAEADSAVVYMLGSIHMGSEDFYPMAEVIENAFESSEFMVTEVDMDLAAIAGDIQKKMFLKAKDSLHKYIHDSTYQKTLAYFKTKDMSEEFVFRLTPMGVFFMITQIEALSSGLTADFGIETYFTKKAKDKKKLALETAASQLKIFEVFEEYPQDLVEYSLASVNEQAGSLDSLVIYWKNGDLKSLEEMVMTEFETENADSEVMKEFTYQILDGRNYKMTEKICSYLKTKGTYFVIVGAAHLVGDKGIVKMLKDKKIKVERL